MPLSVLGMLPDKEVMVGVIDVATEQIESPEQVLGVIDAALAHVDRERLLPCTNCGMAPLPRRVAEGKLAALGAGAALARRKHAA